MGAGLGGGEAGRVVSSKSCSVSRSLFWVVPCDLRKAPRGGDSRVKKYWTTSKTSYSPNPEARANGEGAPLPKKALALILGSASELILHTLGVQVLVTS